MRVLGNYVSAGAFSPVIVPRGYLNLALGQVGPLELFGKRFKVASHSEFVELEREVKAGLEPA